MVSLPFTVNSEPSLIRALPYTTTHTGSPHTLAYYLSTRLPSLFPTQSHSPDLAFPLIQGIVILPETEMAWLGACLAGADGWVNVCVGLFR